MGSSSIALSVRFFGVVFCVPFFPGASSCVYLVLYSVRFPADQFCWRLIAGDFALRFCAGPLFRAFFREAFSARSFAGLSPWVIPRCTFRANFRMDGFHGLFREVVYSVLSGGWIFGSIFSGSFSVQFFAGETSIGAFAWGFFCALFRKGFVCAILCRNFLPALFGRVFLHSLMWSFYPALFCKGDIHKLLRGGYFRTIISSASFRALYR